MKSRILIGGIVALLLLGGGGWLLLHQHHAKLAPTSKKSTNSDTVKPTLQITTSTASLQAVQGTLNVAVDTSDNRGVTHVVYEIDGSFAGVSYAAPFSMSLDVSNLAPGPYKLTATAYDAAGNASQVTAIDFTVVAESTGTGSGSASSGGGGAGSGKGKTTGGTTSPGSSPGSGNSGSGGNSGGSSGDTTAPSAPGNVNASDPGTFFVHLTWTAATDNVGVAGYQVWRSGTMLGTTTGTSYDDHTSVPGGSYQYQVIAYDAASNKTAANSVGIDLGDATVFNSDDTPPGDSGDNSSLEIGMRFRATKGGEITGVRFYKSAADTGTHVGNLWTNSGTNLASVTFTGESASGWQTATFSNPVHVTAGTTYVVSYFAPNGHYTGSPHYFQVPHASNSYLIGLQDGTDGGNGVFTAGSSSAFPSSTFGAANYWVDATFTPDSAATFVSEANCTTYPSFPDPSCTGALGGDGVSALSGGVVFDNDNQVYSNLKVDGNIIVRGCNDTLRNIEVDAGEPFTGNLTTPDLFAIWLQVPPNCPTTIDRVSIITKGAPNIYVTNGIRVANGGPVSITNTRISGTQIGITTGPGTLQDNYVILGPTMRGDHNEDVLEDGTTGLTINHNVLLNPNLQTSVLSLFTENGPNSNLLIENNLLAGGGFTAYAGDGIQDGNGNPIGPPSNISFINNVFWRLYFPDAGFFAAGRDYNTNGGGQWTNNLYMSSNGSADPDTFIPGTLTNEQVPQPPPAS